MINVKIPYVLYPLVLGLMSGWFVSTVVAALSVTVKEVPKPVIKKDIKRRTASEAASFVITKNMFSLSLAPVSAASENPDGSPAAISAAPFNGKLIGLIKNAKNNSGIAVINVDGTTVSIKTGDEKDGMKLVSIDNITAVIEKNNRKYSVLLEGGDTAAITAGTTAAPQGSGINTNISLKRSDIQAELKDLNKILQSALVSPFSQNGELVGYRVTRLRDDSPLKKLGLNQGDIITRINGSELKSPEILFNMVGQIDDISAISIDMIRNNDKKTLFVELQ